MLALQCCLQDAVLSTHCCPRVYGDRAVSRLRCVARRKDVANDPFWNEPQDKPFILRYRVITCVQAMAVVMQ